MSEGEGWALRDEHIEGMRWQSRQICLLCWTKLKGTQKPTRLTDAEARACALCGASTAVLPGIYVRLYLPKESEGGEEEASR